MENHLIGEVVPASDLTPETIAAADVNVVGYSADEGVGAEGGRRRQVRNPESVPGAEQANVAVRYAQAGLSALPVATQIAMTTAQMARYNDVRTQSAAWMQREAVLCDALNGILSGRPAKAVEVLGIPATACDRVRATYQCYTKLSTTRLKELEKNWAVGKIGVDGGDATSFKAGSGY